jgi:phospholipase D1/2
MMGGVVHTGSRLVHDFRVRLYTQHFGLLEGECRDPLHPVLLQKIETRTKYNTSIYREVFACYPDDTVHSLQDYEKVC